MKLLVTGGAGFIGSAFCRDALSRTNDEIINFDLLTYASSSDSVQVKDSIDRYKFVRGDVRDCSAFKELLLAERPDAIVHFAAETHVDRSIAGGGVFVSTNVMGTYSVLQSALEYWSALPGERKDSFRFLHVSTDEVFGALGEEGFFTECSPYRPNSPYSASKAGADHLVFAWAKTYGFPAVVSNCSNNYGPYQFPEKLIPLMVARALKGESLPVYGLGRQVRDWLFVDDHVSALRLILDRGRVGESYCVGGGAELQNVEVVRKICAILDVERPASFPWSSRIAYVEDRPGHDFRYSIDASKIKAELGWEPHTDFDSGLSYTVRWYLNNEAWWKDAIARLRNPSD